MAPQVAHAEGAQERTGHGVQQDVPVGVPLEAALVGNHHTSQPQRPTFHEAVRIDALSDPHRRSSSARSARSRSSGSVILRLPGSPSTTSTGMPNASTSCAQSVPSRPSASAFA